MAKNSRVMSFSIVSASHDYKANKYFASSYDRIILKYKNIPDSHKENQKQRNKFLTFKYWPRPIRPKAILYKLGLKTIYLTIV